MKKNLQFGAIIFGIIALFAVFYVLSLKNDNGKINIASLLPFDGSVADMGEMMRNGQILAMEEINQKATVLGDSLAITFLNTSHKKDQALDRLKECKNKGIDFIAEIFGSDQAEHCLPYAFENNLFILSGVDTKPDLTKKGKGSFYRIMPNDAAASDIILQWTNELKLNRIAVVYANDDWGKGLNDATIQNISKYNMKIVENRDVIKNQPSFIAIISRLKELNPDAVFLYIYADDGGRLLKEAQKQNFKCNFFATENFTGIKVVENAKDAINGVRMVRPSLSEDSEQYKKFAENYKNRFGTDPTIFSIKGYDAVHVLYEIIKQSNSDVNSAKKIMKGYKGSGVSGSFSFDEMGEFIPGKYDRMIFTRQNGVFEPVLTNN